MRDHSHRCGKPKCTTCYSNYSFHVLSHSNPVHYMYMSGFINNLKLQTYLCLTKFFWGLWWEKVFLNALLSLLELILLSSHNAPLSQSMWRKDLMRNFAVIKHSPLKGLFTLQC